MKITPEGDAAFRTYLEGLRAYLGLGDVAAGTEGSRDP